MNQALINRCVEAWIAAYLTVGNPRDIRYRDHQGRQTDPDNAGRSSFEGETADELLERGGIRFDADPSLFCDYEREIRRRALARLGVRGAAA